MLLKTVNYRGIEAAESKKYVSADDAFKNTMPKSEVNSPDYHEFVNGYNNKTSAMQTAHEAA